MLILSLLILLGSTDVVYPPLSKTGPVKLGVFLQGGKVPIEYYNKTITSIQQQTQAQLWMAVPDFSYLGNLCIVTGPLAVRHQVSSAIAAANKQAGTTFKPEDTIIFGHSLGTTCAGFLRGEGYAGFALFGGCAPYKQFNSVEEPTYCLTGELDLGMIPVLWSYFLTEVEALSEKQGSLPLAMKTAAIGLIPKMCHLDFCPGYYDLSLHFTSELEPEDATNQIGLAVSSWLHLQFGVRDDMDTLMKYYDNAQNILSPYRRAAAIQNTTWCERAQQVMTHPSDDQWNKITVNTTFLKIDNEIELEHLHTAVIPNADNTSFVVNVGGMSEYDRGRSTMISQGLVLSPASATDVACKMVSRDKLGQAFGEKWEIDRTCMDVNKDALLIANELMQNTHIQDRFNRIGKQVKLIEDSSTVAGPQWCFTKLGWKEKDDHVEVQSVTLVSPLSSSFYPGNHYCKLLSPARVIEWAMAWGLPKNVSAH